MGFDRASTFSGKRIGVQTRIKKLTPHALFVHCHCHLLQLACVQAAHSTAGIKHVYVSLMALWKYFLYSPKSAKSLRAVQSVLDLPEFKIANPSNTRWQAHERCVKAVKASYAAIVVAFDNIHENTHEPEALGLRKSLSKRLTTLSHKSQNSAKHSKPNISTYCSYLASSIPPFVHWMTQSYQLQTGCSSC